MRNFLVTLAILISLNGFSQVADKYDRIIDSLVAAGQEDNIIPWFEKEALKQPKNDSLLRSLAGLYIADNKLDQAEKCYRQAIDANPKCARCYVHLGRIFAMKNDQKKAMEQIDKAISMDPKDAFLYSSRAQVKEAMGNKLGALMDHNQSIELDPKNAEYYAQRALYNSRQGYSSVALADLGQAIELSPKDQYLYFNRANIYYDQHRFMEALADVNIAVQLDTTDALLYIGRGAVHAAIGEYDRSIADYTSAIRLDPEDHGSYHSRALSKYRKEDMDGSCADLHLCMEVLKKNGGDSLFEKDILFALDDYCDSAKPSYYYQRGIALYNLQKFDEAVIMYSRGLKKFPGHHMLLSFRGNANFKLKQYDQVIADLSEAISSHDKIVSTVRTDPRYRTASADSLDTYINAFCSSATLTMAESRFALGKPEEALADVNRSVGFPTPFSKEENYSVRGNIYLVLNKFDLALADFDEAIRLRPDFSDAYADRAVAKINRAIEMKMTNKNIYGGVNGQHFSPVWVFPAKAGSKKAAQQLESALADCDQAIKLNSENPYALFIRGQIKQMTGQDGACYDLMKAKQLGFPVEEELLKGCK